MDHLHKHNEQNLPLIYMQPKVLEYLLDRGGEIRLEQIQKTGDTYSATVKTGGPENADEWNQLQQDGVIIHIPKNAKPGSRDIFDIRMKKVLFSTKLIAESRPVGTGPGFMGVRRS